MKQLLGLIKNIKIDLIFLVIWIIVWSELLTNLTINNKIPLILINGLLYTTIFFYLKTSYIFKLLKKIFGAHTFGHSILQWEKYSCFLYISFFFFFWYPVSYFNKQIKPCKPPATISWKLAVAIKKCFKEKQLPSITVFWLRRKTKM